MPWSVEGKKNAIFALKIIHGISFNSLKVQVPSVVSEPHTICTISPSSCNFLPNSSTAHSLCHKLWSEQSRHASLSSFWTVCSLSLESFLPGYSHYSLPWFLQVLAQLWTLSEALHTSLCKVLNTLLWPWHSQFPISSSISFHGIHHNLTYYTLYLLMFTVCLLTRKKIQETKDSCLFYSLMYL